MFTDSQHHELVLKIGMNNFKILLLVGEVKKHSVMLILPILKVYVGVTLSFAFSRRLFISKNEV